MASGGAAWESSAGPGRSDVLRSLAGAGWGKRQRALSRSQVQAQLHPSVTCNLGINSMSASVFSSVNRDEKNPRTLGCENDIERCL